MYKFLHRHYHLRYHNIYRHAKKLFIFDLALLCLAVILFVSGLFFFLWKPGITDQIDIQISLGNNRLRSGDLTTISVNYVNRSKYKLDNVSLALHLPVGFVIDQSQTPESIFNSSQIFTQIKQIPAGAKNKIEVIGRLWTDPDKEDRILVNLSYQPENMSRKEQKLAHYLINQPDSVLQNFISVATSSFGGQKLNFVYTITNDSSETIRNIKLVINETQSKIIDEKDKTITLGPNEKKMINGQITLPVKSAIYEIKITPQISINDYLLSQKPA